MRTIKEPGLPYTTDELEGWAWNRHRLEQKIERGDSEDCWRWRGGSGPDANLFGAYRRLESGEYRTQMTQASRLIYRQEFRAPVNGKKVVHACGNKYCCNPNHMALEPDYRGGRFREKNKRSTRL